mmetsp:Transcript_21318/g.26226  ORF Transcript_21318/g.26226 Transcript_21318/m.26226 type:complete len:106 (+) Transcript_21318:35-352(+)
MAPRSTGENMAGSFGTSTGSKGAAGMALPNMAAMAGLESLEVDDKTADEIINNVEKMIKAEQTKDAAAKKDKKAEAKTLDLTEAASGKVGASAAESSSSKGARTT